MNESGQMVGKALFTNGESAMSVLSFDRELSQMFGGYKHVYVNLPLNSSDQAASDAATKVLRFKGVITGLEDLTKLESGIVLQEGSVLLAIPKQNIGQIMNLFGVTKVSALVRVTEGGEATASIVPEQLLNAGLESLKQFATKMSWSAEMVYPHVLPCGVRHLTANVQRVASAAVERLKSAQENGEAVSQHFMTVFQLLAGTSINSKNESLWIWPA